MKNFSLGLFLMVFGFLFTNTINAQVSSAKATPPPLPLAVGKNANLRLATADEISQVMRAKALTPNARVQSETEATPIFAVEAYGDAYENGVSGNAINTAEIPAQSIFGSCDGDHYAWATDEKLVPGQIFYNLENQRKLGYTEAPKVLDLCIMIYTFGKDGGFNYREFYAVKKLGDYSFVAPQTIEEHEAYNDGNAPLVKMYGNFGRAAGVLMQIPGYFTINVDPVAVLIQGHRMTIDFSKMSIMDFPAGDYKFTVVDSSGYSDSGHGVRILSRQQYRARVKAQQAQSN